MDCSILECISVQNLDSSLPKLKMRLSSESRTAKLWIQYMQCNDTDKDEFNNEDEELEEESQEFAKANEHQESFYGSDIDWFTEETVDNQ